MLVQEAAEALASIGRVDQPGLVTGCRRLIDRHPGLGPMWWLAARVLCSGDPTAEAWGAAAELEDDPTTSILAAHLPEDATVTVIGWPEQAADALRRRGDIEVLVVGDMGLVRRLVATDIDAVDVPFSGLGAAVKESSLVLLDADALGPGAFSAAAGSLAAAAVARLCDVETWVVAGTGRVLPGRMWDALVSRLEGAGDPWDVDTDVVPLDWAASVVGPVGPQPAADAPKRADCPIAPELLKVVR